MTTEKDLIAKLQSLKQIKPNAQWVVLTKKQIFQVPSVMPEQKATFANFSGMFIQKRLAYAFAALSIVFAGSMGFVKYSSIENPVDLPSVSTASLLSRNDFNASIASFKKSSQDLAEATQGSNVDSAVKGVKDASRILADAVKKDSSLAKAVALQIKGSETLLSVVSNTSVQQTSQNLYITIAQQMISDLQKTSLSKDQQHQLDQAMVLYQEGKYAEVLEKLLLI